MNKPEQKDIWFQKIMELQGVEEFKEVVKSLEIFRKNKELHSVNNVRLPNYLWYFKRGGGVSTCLKAFAEYLSASKLMDFKGEIEFFEFIPNYIPPVDYFDELSLLDRVIIDSAGHNLHFRGIACIILDNWIDKTKEKHFLRLLDYLENKNDKILLIFCTHTDNPTIMEKIESAIASYIRFDKIKFRFPDANELINFIEERFLLIYNLTLSDEAKLKLTETLIDISNGENFNGFVTINQLGNDILFKILSAGINGNVITSEMLSDFNKNSAYINSLKKISKCSVGFNINKGSEK